MRALDPCRRVHGKIDPCLVGIHFLTFNLKVRVAIFLGLGSQGPSLLDELVHSDRNCLLVGSKVDVLFVLVILKNGHHLRHDGGPIVDLDSGHRKIGFGESGEFWRVVLSKFVEA